MNIRARPPQGSFALFAYGFRPFFLLAIWQAVVVVPVWLWIWTSGTTPVAPLPATIWHGHEMVFGFVSAAVTGFLLTAVPSWTGARGHAGSPLQLLALLWLGGRLGFALAGVLPVWATGLLELSFLPAVGYFIAKPLLRERNRNFPLLFVLGALWLSDACVIAGMFLPDAELARKGISTGLDVVLVLVTVIGGRIVPAFTANALRSRGLTKTITNSPALDRGVIAVMVAIALMDAVGVNAQLTAATAALAAVLHAARMARWRGHLTLRLPIVCVLHVAYAWLVIGLLLKALALGLGVAWAGYWLHALGIGGAATMIVAVLTRAALGHTGRPLVAPRPAVLGYFLIVAAAFVRVFGPACADYYRIILTAGLLWSLAFSLIAWSYTPILVQPRIDGRSG